MDECVMAWTEEDQIGCRCRFAKSHCAVEMKPMPLQPSWMSNVRRCVSMECLATSMRNERSAIVSARTVSCSHVIILSASIDDMIVSKVRIVNDGTRSLLDG